MLQRSPNGSPKNGSPRLRREERVARMRKTVAGELARRGVLPTQRDVLRAAGGGAALALEVLAEFRRAELERDVLLHSLVCEMAQVLLAADRGGRLQIGSATRERWEMALRALPARLTSSPS